MPTLLQSDRTLSFPTPEEIAEAEGLIPPRLTIGGSAPVSRGGHPLTAVKPVVVVFNAVAIRDTVSHFPTALLDLRNARQWAMEIDNSLDQNLTVELIGSITDRPDSAGDLGVDSVSTLGTFEPIASSVWSPFIGVRLIAATAPTTGLVTVRGQVQVEE